MFASVYAEVDPFVIADRLREAGLEELANKVESLI